MSGALTPSAGLSVSDIIAVNIFLQPTAAPLRNFGAFLIIGPTIKTIDTAERMRVYTTLSGVTNDFGTTTPEYLAANLFFSQSPNPAILYIGRWAQSATQADLHGGTPTAANQVVSGWTGVTTGSLSITIDGSVKTLSGLNFSSQTNMNGVAGVIQTGLGGSITCVWNANYNRFEIYSGTTGPSSTMTYATPTGSGVDISTKSGLSLAGGASAPVNGIAAETPVSALAALALFGSWYGCMFSPTSTGDITDAQYLACAALVQGLSPSRIMGVTSMEAASLDPTQSTDFGSQAKALSYSRTFVQYSSSSAYAVASAYARAFTVNFQGNNTVITLKFKTEPGVAAEFLNESQWQSLKGKNTNVFVNYANGTAILQEGVMADGTFFDIIHGTDWLQNQAQTDVFNLFYTSPTKIPQTDPGMHMVAAVLENSMVQGVANGLIAPGQWNAPGFGQIAFGQMLPKGYYIFMPAINSQNQSDRAARKAVPIQVAIKLAGAIHSANVAINVNA